MVTDMPCFLRAYAAVKPVMPAPTIAMEFMWLDSFRKAFLGLGAVVAIELHRDITNEQPARRRHLKSKGRHPNQPVLFHRAEPLNFAREVLAETNVKLLADAREVERQIAHDASD